MSALTIQVINRGDATRDLIMASATIAMTGTSTTFMIMTWFMTMTTFKNMSMTSNNDMSMTSSRGNGSGE